MQKYTQVMVIFKANFNSRAVVQTLHAKRTMRCKIVYFTRQRFARAIIDADTLRSLFLNISRIFGIGRRFSTNKY